MRIVTDASAVLYATSPALPQAAARWEALLVEHEAVAPTLLALELGNVIQRKRPDEFGRDPAARAEALRVALEGIDLVPLAAGDLGAIARACEEERVSFYDACYLELAERDDESILLTRDDELLRAARRRLGPRRAAMFE